MAIAYRHLSPSYDLLFNLIILPTIPQLLLSII